MDNILISKITHQYYLGGLGIGHAAPRFVLIFSGRYETSGSILVPWPAPLLKSRDIAEVSVRAIGERLSTPWSAPAIVEVALLDRSDWTADLIESAVPQLVDATKQQALFQKEFVVNSAEKSRLYIAAHGINEAKINGQKVGDRELAPGWTSYNHPLNYQVYNVQSLLRQGTNTLVVEVGEGWYALRLSFMGGVCSIYGEQVGLFAQLEGGGSVLTKTDNSRTCGAGAILKSEVYDWEVVDEFSIEYVSDARWPPKPIHPLPPLYHAEPDEFWG